MRPKYNVSVIMPVYNSAAYLQEAIESVVSQTGVSVELIVVDDGSVDGSQDIARTYSCVKLIQQQHAGACAARNRGLHIATGTYVKFFDSDDILEPNILQRQVECSESVDERTIIYGDVFYFNEGNSDTRLKVVEMNKTEDQVSQLFKMNINTPAPLHRRCSLIDIGGFDERLTSAQEYNLHLRLAIQGFRFERLEGIVARIRKHSLPHSISNMRKQEDDDQRAIRGEIYSELLNSYYGNSMPAELRRYFLSQKIIECLLTVSRGDIRGAWKKILAGKRDNESLVDWVWGIGAAFKYAVRKKGERFLGVWHR